MTHHPGDLTDAIAAAVIVRDSKLLLIRRRISEGELLWALPSGGIEPGETAEDAAARETKEEVGLNVKPMTVLGERIHPNTGRRMIYVACTPDHGEAQVLDHEEIAEVTWAADEELSDYVPYGFYENVQDYLKTALAGFK
jgi:8-oxo-dGTP diphosphatase